LQPRTVRHPLRAVAQLSTAKEADAMNDQDDFIAYINETLARGKEDHPELTTFLGILKRLRAGEAADGQPWPENDVSPGRRSSLARAERAMVGLQVVIEMLHAAERCRVAADPERHLDEGTVEALFFACRGLAEWACREVRPEIVRGFAS